MALVISSLHLSTSRPGWLEPAGTLVFAPRLGGAVLTEFADADIIIRGIIFVRKRNRP